jgi:hypothetical protein
LTHNKIHCFFRYKFFKNINNTFPKHNVWSVEPGIWRAWKETASRSLSLSVILILSSVTTELLTILKV